MADEIKAGDIVRLKSGGPEMTVSSVKGGFAFCEWFDDKQQHQGQPFKPAVLVVVKSSGAE